MASVSSVENAQTPRVWLLMGEKAGDNEQVLALAESLGWPFEIKRFRYKPYELWSNLFLGPNLFGVEGKAVVQLSPPWPDLVISAGRRNEPISRWIRAKSNARGVKLVHIGRPWAPLQCFDLIVSTPQYELPRQDNVLVNPLPMHRLSAERLALAEAEWHEELVHLPRPRIALLVGGNSGPYLLDRPTAERLAKQSEEQVARGGGSLMITTSGRTPAEAVEQLSRAFICPHVFIPWHRGSSKSPYLAFLSLADAFIVTGDSMSMLTEATSTGKPVYIFAFGHGRLAMNPGEAGNLSARRSDFHFWKPGRWKAFISRLALRLGPTRLTRDIRRIHDLLVTEGRAAWLGSEEPPGNSAEPADSVKRARDRVRSLFEAGDPE